jgi:hypothetical protein
MRVSRLPGRRRGCSAAAISLATLSRTYALLRCLPDSPGLPERGSSDAKGVGALFRIPCSSLRGACDAGEGPCAYPDSQTVSRRPAPMSSWFRRDPGRIDRSRKESGLAPAERLPPATGLPALPGFRHHRPLGAVSRSRRQVPRTSLLRSDTGDSRPLSAPGVACSPRSPGGGTGEGGMPKARGHPPEPRIMPGGAIQRIVSRERRPGVLHVNAGTAVRAAFEQFEHSLHPRAGRRSEQGDGVVKCCDEMQFVLS